MASRSLPVLFPAVAGQKWSCHSCGDCCRTLVGHLTLTERDRILEQGWQEKLGVVPVVRAGRSWVLNKRSDGACVFLSADNRCRIHAEFGEAAKPLACRIFPFSVRPTSHGWQASLRFDCPSVARAEGQPLSTHRPWLGHLVSEMDQEAVPRDDPIYLAGGTPAEPREVEGLQRRVASWLGDPTLGLDIRLTGFARVLSLLSQAKLKNVRGDRFLDMLDILFDTIRGDQSELPLPTGRQRGMLRQVVLAHAEHVTLVELRSGLLGRLRLRRRQFQAARRMLKGEGEVPPLPGIASPVLFEQVERIEPAENDAIRIEHLLGRYLTARLEGDSVFGAGYYGWSILDGYAALCLSIAVAGWLARDVAAAGGSPAVKFEHAATALAIADRAATRLPALGTWAEKKRIQYLFMEDGLARLLSAYPLTRPG